MTSGTEAPPPAAVLFDLDDVLVPLRTVGAWQWAWRPQGPLLSARRVQSAVRRGLRAWDRQRWRAATGRGPALGPKDLHDHLATTLQAIAGHALAEAESEAVVRRLLHPAGEVERFADVAPALERLERAATPVGILTDLPRESALWLLKRAGLPEPRLLGAGDPPGPVVPDRAAFRAATERLGVEPGRTAYVGDLYWSDVRAAHRAGLGAVLVDRVGAWPHVQPGRLGSLDGLDAALREALTGAGAATSDDAPPGPEDDRSSGDFL